MHKKKMTKDHMIRSNLFFFYHGPVKKIFTMVDPVAMCTQQFADLQGQFLESLIEVFPECDTLAQLRVQFNLANMLPSQKTERVEEWLQYMQPFFQACTQRQALVVMKNEHFPPSVQAMDIEGKWTDPDIDEDTREAVWAYLDELNRLAQMYSLYKAVPGGMMSNITQIAESMAAQMADGHGMNGVNFQQITEQVQQQIKPEDMDAFASGVDPSMFTNLLSSMMGGGHPRP